MRYSQKTSGRASAMPAGLLYGALVSMIITVIGSAVTAKLMDMETVGSGAVGYAVLLMLMLASYLGAAVSCRRIKRQYLAVCLLSGTVYFLILLSITALFFGGQYEAVGVTGILVLGGSLLALLTGTGVNKAGKRRRCRKRNR